MKKEIIKNIIKDFHKGPIQDSKQRDILVPINIDKIITLSGVRRSGKTFILFEVIKNVISKGVSKERILYMNFEDERLDLKQEELDLILQGYRELYPDISLSKCYFFFDEIQNLSGWELFVRRVYDTITKNIFLTGSNSKLLSKEIATSLRGRTVTFEVFPLTFKEYLRFNGIKKDIYHSQTKAKIANIFEKFLFEGGFPEILNFKEKSLKTKTLQEYFDVMIYRDLVERFNITNIHILKYFIKRIFENITNPLSIHNIYNELKSNGYKIGKNYLYEYLVALESIYLFLILPKYSESVLKRELGEKKVYAIDNGLLNAVTFKFSNDYGKLLENVIFMELHKSGCQLFFYKGKRECDFIVLEKSKFRYVIQVAYSVSEKKTLQRETEGLAEACRVLGEKKGYIITLSEEKDLTVEDISIHIIPAYKFLLTILI